jgi:protein phosphatase
MGTTLCCLIWTKEAVVYAHVGDSRVYRLRNKKLTLLTQDHSLFAKWLATGKLAEECETPYPYKHVITRAIGGPGKANPEIAVAIHQDGDIFFLCSDGLTDVLSLGEMEEILKDTSQLQKSAHLLIEKAKIKGSSDNMTVVMVQF